LKEARTRTRKLMAVLNKKPVDSKVTQFKLNKVKMQEFANNLRKLDNKKEKV